MAGERRVKILFEAEIRGFKKAMQEAAEETRKVKKASEEAGKQARQNADELAKAAKAHQDAAKAVGLQYDKTGQLVTMNGKALSSQQAAAHGLESFSKEAYLAGKAAEDAANLTGSSFSKMAEHAKENSEAWQTVGTTIMGVGAATVAGVGLAVKTYADFDKAMSGVQAATHESTQNMELLREAAIAAGADTAFSAEEAAKGVEELAKAGVSTADVLDGGLNGALALAAAGELEVGAAAEIAASAMTQFGLEGAKIPHIADLLAAGAGKAQGSVHDMGEALNQVGLVANNTGLTIEETAGGLAAFASAGLTGSDAGTSFKSMLQRLTPQSEAAATLMDELGVSAYDSAGEFVGLSEYAGILQGALKDMAPEQRNAAMQTLFGADAVRAASVLYEQGAEGVQKWEDAVNDAGYAAETAALLQDNLAGDLEKLGGSFDTVMLQSGSGANEVLRGFVQGLEDVVDTIGKIPAPVLSIGTMVAGVLGGAALLGGGLITVVPKILETKEAFDLLAPAGGKADKALRGVAKAAAAAGAIAAVGIAAAKIAEAGYLDDLQEGSGHIAEALQELANKGPGAASALDEIFKDRNGDGITTQISDLDSAIEYLFSDDPGQKFNLWGQDVVNSLTGIKGGKQIAEDTFRGIDAEISAMVTSGSIDDAKDAFETIKDRLVDSGVGAEEAAALFPQYEDALARTAAEEASASTGAAELQSALEEVGVTTEGVIENMEDFLELLFASGLATMSSRDANAAYHDALREVDETIKTINESGGEMGSMLNKNKSDFDLTTEAGKLANDTFQNIAQGGMAEVEAMSKEGLGQDELQAKLRTTHDDLVQAGIDMGLHEDKAGDLARAVLGVPDGIDIDTWMEDTARREADNTAAAVNAIPDGKTVHTKFIRTFETHGIPFPSAPTDPGAGAFERLGGVATGGRLPGFSDGGQLPTTGPGTSTTDGIVGINAMGTPVARVDAGEWIINSHSSEKYNRTLAAINAGTFPTLPGYASGGQVGMAPANYGPRIDLGGITINGATDANAVRRAVVDEIQWKFQQNGVRLG